MLYFLTVNYYSKNLISSLVLSISKSVTSPCQILVVNNSPKEASIHDLASDYVSVIEPGKNIGFGRACNLGIRYAWAQNSNALVWLINPDATLEPGADACIMRCLQLHPDIAILGTGIRDLNGGDWFSVGTFKSCTGFINDRPKNQELRQNPTIEILESDWVSGCSLVLNLGLFSECPLFDPDYFLYCEDVDFCRRLSRQGYRIAVTRRALVNHQVSATIGARVEFQFRQYVFSRLLLLWRHASLLGFLVYSIYLGGKISFLLIKNQEEAKGRALGIMDFFIRIRFLLKRETEV
jgi:N-acetylglucosaminyl-diphospho-decaprenol L-rhamnosyltransferase